MVAWFKKLGVAFTALVVTLGMALGIGAAPAQAAFGGVCAGNAFCLYQWTGLGAQVEGNRWQTSYANLEGSGGCITLGSAKWANGTNVGNNSGSIMWKTTSGIWEQYAITVFNWDGCNTAGQWEVIGYAGSAGTQWSLDNLNNYAYSDSGSSIKLYHTISSIGFRCVIC